MFNNLSDENILLYAVKAYDKPSMMMSEFDDDMKRFNYLNRLFTRYKRLGELRERLVVNHLVILNNVFGPEVVVRLLFYKISNEHYSILKTYLLFLNIMKSKIIGIDGIDIISSDIPVDMNIVEVLRKIK
ncbi:hypothetical protein M0R04_05110 [Candidatus Dojkabacteria bacterium]|jgi:hypothetical protein|nr:hypothetical protein [Candidatus Dojkabacteria bacterium]